MRSKFEKVKRKFENIFKKISDSDFLPEIRLFLPEKNFFFYFDAQYFDSVLVLFLIRKRNRIIT